MKRLYQSLPEFDDKEIKRILQFGSIEELTILPLSVGEYHANWKTAQNICVELSNHSDEQVRANSALGLAYIARTKGKLEKHIVKPILLEILRNCSEHRNRVIDSIQDINIFMEWSIGEKAIGGLEKHE
ncbi:hypothetical protein JZO77_13510 [Enterococcus hulanensis]|uniref:hypothetical protein n=1 Tax=Enterococcus hulanensis TaxID=2559929 RepID=UPI001A8E4B87|nr:hypothetical protein [Enterococcus hulanensis]MBO0457752.1 hypothetical protein [Enterococcus hulanensis]